MLAVRVEIDGRVCDDEVPSWGSQRCTSIANSSLFFLLYLSNRLNQRSFGETKSRGDHRWIVVSPASYGRNRLMKKQTNGGHAGFRPESDELINTAKLNPNQKRNETGRRRPDEMGG